MRNLATVLVALILATALQAQEKKPAARYGIEPDLANYPQKTAKETLDSVIKAIERKRIDYTVAQLADPDFVDKRVKDYGGKFEELVKEATQYLLDDPEAVKKLRRFLKDGEWEETEATAAVKLKDVKEKAYLRKIGERWYLENRVDEGKK